jgi:hypothetical protein
MLSLVFHTVIKGASIAENDHNLLTKNEKFFSDDGCLYHPVKHHRKHFIVYKQKEKYTTFKY